MGGTTIEDTIVAEPPKVHGWSTRLIDRISGAADAKDETQRRRVRILFLLLAAVTPLLVFAGNSGQTIFGDDQLQLWSGVIVGVALVFFAISRIFNAEKTIGVLLGFWALAVIAHGPLFYGDPTQVSLTTLVLVPLIMGSVSGASASLLGTISVILTYVAVLASAYFQRHTEAESTRLIRDNAKVREIALTDSLTRCHNRRAFQIAVDELSREASRTTKPALFIMDLDRFKQINDTFGHDVGDEVLRAFSERLQTAITEDASVFRLGGDEFAILLPDEPSQVALEGVARRIIDLCEDSIPTAAGDVDFDVSIGIALSDGSDIANEQLYRQADNAAFAAKKRAGSSYLVFNTQIDGQITRQYEVEECLKVAIAKRSIDIAFQPQYDLRGGAIVSYEALARWRDPLLGKVSPAEFIQIAEKTRLVEVLDRQILSISLRNAQTWLGRQQKVSVNVSARTLKSQDFADYVLKHVQRNQLYPDQVEIEITETALIENWQASKATVENLRKAGIRIVLDDFGIGYSSLSYLAEFPIQKIKFDRSFLLKAFEHSNSLIMRSIINLAKEMKMEMVAEGVETRKQLRLLRSLECYHGQGYLLGRPIPAKNMDRFVRSRRKVA